MQNWGVGVMGDYMAMAIDYNHLMTIIQMGVYLFYISHLIKEMEVISNTFLK